MEQWLIARNGEQEGPVTAQQIATLVRSGSLDPAMTHCWREGMPDWIPLVESGLLTTTAPAPVSAAAALNNPYMVTKRTIESPIIGALDYLGIGRVAYIVGTIIITIVFYALLVAVAFSMLKSGGDGAGAAGVGMFVLVLLMIAATMYIGVKRVQNLGMSGWAVLWSLVPFMNIWIGWRMFACPAGYEDHRTLDTAGKVITGIWIGLFALAIVVNIFAAIAGN